MSKKNKLFNRLCSRPKDFSWDELQRLLTDLGYVLVKQGKTGGSRRRFIHPELATITLHKPHPENVLKRYQINQLIELLQQEGLI